MKTGIFKKYISVAVCLYLLLVLAACQKQSVWQEQYDLGMKYLTESNYEEAILAFTAAIEIDPNNIDSYIYLIQAQLVSGDIEGAEETRKNGYKMTRDEIFQYVINEYTSLLIYMRDLPFEKRTTYVDYSKLSSNEQALIRQSISLLLSKEYESLQELLLNSSLPWQICTETDGYKVEIDIIRNSEEFARYLWYREEDNKQNNAFLCMEIRPLNGTGYAYTYWSGMDQHTDMNGEYIADTPFKQETYQVCECVDGQYNGEWCGEEYNEYVFYGFSRDGSGWISEENSNKNKSIRIGQMKDYIITINTLQEEIELTSTWGIYNSEMVYKNGKVISYKINGVEEEYPYSISDEYLIACFDDLQIRLRYW